MAGALIVNNILGLGQPLEYNKTIEICPHPGDIAWAHGTALCSDGVICFGWYSDSDNHIIDMYLSMPEGWGIKIKFPFELENWVKILNGDRM